MVAAVLGEAQSVTGLTLSELLERTAAEIAAFRVKEATDGLYGYELMRRAIVLRDEGAWVGLMSLYRGLVLHWVGRRYGTAERDLMTADDWVYAVFGRFATSIQAEQFEDFPSLSSLLRYLRRCAETTLAEERRAQQRHRHLTLEPGVVDRMVISRSDPSAEMLDQISATGLWQLVMATTKSAAERTYAHHRFVQLATPREIATLHPELFVSVRDVYRTGRNLVERLRRLPEIRALLSEYHVAGEPDATATADEVVDGGAETTHHGPPLAELSDSPRC